MSRNQLLILSVLATSILLPSCEIIGDIFQAGMWSAFIIIFVVIALIIWIVSRFRRK